MLLSKSE